MVKPMDLDEFFKEQQERLNISDSDWEQYEERMYQDRKRKRMIDKQPGSSAPIDESDDAVKNKSTGDKRSMLPGSIHSHKKRKVSQTTKPSDFIVLSSTLPSIVTSPNPDQTSLRDKAAASRLPGEAARILRKDIVSTSVDTPQAPLATSPSSDVTTPTITPCQASTKAFPNANVADGSSGGIQDGNLKRLRVQPFKSRLKVEDQGTSRSNESEKKQTSADRAAIYAKQAEKAKKAQDDQEKLMTPLQYAAILRDKWHARVSNTPPEKLFLRNNVIYLVFEEQNKSTKDTRIKLDIIARSGGQVATYYDPEIVTHIIPGGRTITLKKTLRALGLRSLSEIPPDIHTVKWDWIVSGLSNGTPDSEIMHESFKQRITQRYIKRQERGDIKGKGKVNSWSTTNEHSVIEEFTSKYDSQDDGENSVPQRKSPHASSLLQGNAETSSLPIQNEQKEDPLLPFYSKAREEAETADSDGESRVGIRTLPYDSITAKLKGFQCDKKSMHLQGISPNWDIIEKLAELREMHRDNGADDDKWRVISYQRAIGSLKTYPTRIKSREEALKLSGISGKTADKIMEIIRTGELRRIKYTKTEGLKVMKLFNGIYGVGPSTARKWFHQGLKSLGDIRRAIENGTHKLSVVQKIGLEFYEDINDRMPRKEAEEIFLKIQSIALDLDAKLSLEIMGSFRRGKETCGDIDILLTRNTDDGKTHAGVLFRLYNHLHKQGILTEDLALPDEWGGLEATYRGLCRRDGGSRRRRIDILCIPYECRGAARIYYTGDDIFNRSIRLKANKMNMSLNQRGLFQEVIRDPKDRTKKLCAGSLLCSDSEEKIFELLGVPWQEPHERVRGG